MTAEKPETSTIDERKKNALHPPTANRLLCELPEEVKQRIFPHLELIELKLGQIISEAGSKLRYVYFPTDSIISLLYVMEKTKGYSPALPPIVLFSALFYSASLLFA